MAFPRDDWPRLKEVFTGALAQPTDRRSAYLAAACDGNEALRREVESLLFSHERADSLFETPAVVPRDDTRVARSFEGQRIGSYQIASRIGAGGMGEVYQARDTTLNRQVAIKVLLPAVAGDPDRLARFRNEARVLASLNHPHVAQIHGFEDADGVHALVMELVDGPTLADRIIRGALPIDEALTIASQIADALSAAHEQGIIHRDLKPANIKVREDGTVKVLDFGLAKVPDVESSAAVDVMQSPAMSAHATGAGLILGTAAYMSPEQARGKAVDRRTDLWAFGCVLYEMLTGQRTFGGESPTDVLTAVATIEPDWTRLPAATPAAIRTLLRRCLEKNRARRLDSAMAARLEIDDEILRPGGNTIEFPLRRVRRQSVLVAALSVALVAALVVWAPWRPTLMPPETRTEIVTPATADPTSFALSPDGRQMVFVASGDGPSRLWLRSLASATAQPLSGTEGATSPFWAPDSRAIGFFAGGALKRLDLPGGAPQILAPAGAARGGTWSADNVIVFAPTTYGHLMRVPATGGDAVALTTLGPPHSGRRWPHMLPDGRRFLFYGLGPPDATGIFLGAFDGGPPTRLTPADGSGVYLPGWLLWVRGGVLVAQRLDLEQAVLTGDPVTLANGVAVDEFLRSGVSVASTGLVAYRTGIASQRQLIWVDRSGATRGAVGNPDGNNLRHPRVSPDGRRVAVSRLVQGNTDLWLLDGARMSRLTFDAALDQSPLWSPDGSRIVFETNRTGRFFDLHQVLSSGAGVEERLVVSEQHKVPSSWSADGRFLLFMSMGPTTSSDLWVVPTAGDRTPWVFLGTPFNEVSGAFSPDGRWVAYQSNEGGPNEIYVRPFVPPAAGTAAAPGRRDPPGGQWKVSTTGGGFPV